MGFNQQKMVAYIMRFKQQSYGGLMVFNKEQITT